MHCQRAVKYRNERLGGGVGEGTESGSEPGTKEECFFHLENFFRRRSENLPVLAEFEKDYTCL